MEHSRRNTSKICLYKKCCWIMYSILCCVDTYDSTCILTNISIDISIDRYVHRVKIKDLSGTRSFKCNEEVKEK